MGANVTRICRNTTIGRLARLLAAAVCTLVAITLASGTARAATVEVNAHGDTAEGRELLALVNADRAAHGLAPLAWDECLEQVALQRGCEQTLSYSHTRPDGTGWDTAFPATAAKAENLAWNQRSAAEANACWVASPAHHANMLRPDVTRFAAAHVVGSDGSHFWVECLSADTGHVNQGTQPVVGPVVARVNV